MDNHQPSGERVPANIRVVYITKNSDAFGLTDAGESVYIPPFFVHTQGVTRDERRDVFMIRNDPEHVERGVPWRVCFVEPAVKVEAAPEEPVEDVITDEEIVLEALEDVGIMSTKQLAAELDLDTVRTRHVLDSMHRAEQVVRADVYRTVSQGTASMSVWALSAKTFTKFAAEVED